MSSTVGRSMALTAAIGRRGGSAAASTFFISSSSAFVVKVAKAAAVSSNAGRRYGDMVASSSRAASHQPTAVSFLPLLTQPSRSTLGSASSSSSRIFTSEPSPSSLRRRGLSSVAAQTCFGDDGKGDASVIVDDGVAALTFDERCILAAENEWASAAAEAAAASPASLAEDKGGMADDDPYLAELLASNGITYDELVALASLRTTPLSLANMYRYASAPDSESYSKQRLRNAQFLHRELPIRIAQRTVDLLALPLGLDRTRPVRSVAGTYLNYLRHFRAMPPPTNEEEETAFTDMLHEHVLDRTSIPSAVARGFAELKESRRELDVQRLSEMEDALYRFFTARVGLRFLTEHHVLSARGREEQNAELRKRQSCLDYDYSDDENDESYVRTVDMDAESDADLTEDEAPYLGCIQKNCDPVLQARKVAAQVTRQCRERYGMSPEVEIVDCTSAADVDKDFTYVPHHLQYMLAELLKNSCRATVQRYLSPSKTLSSLPPIRVVIVKGAEDVTINVADRAGGMTRSALRKIWSFSHTTSDVDFSPSSEQEPNGVDSLTADDAARFEVDEFSGGSDARGFGLPLARIYARYFGGELTVKSMEGHGVDAYLYLPVLGTECENCRTDILVSPGNLDSTHRRGFVDGNADEDEYAEDWK